MNAKKVSINANTLVVLGICGYLTFILFNGFLKHLGLSVRIIETVRPVLPEMCLLLVFLALFIQGFRFIKQDIHYLIYLVFVSVISAGSYYSTNAFLTTVRDFYLPVLLLCMLSAMNISREHFILLKKWLCYIFTIFVIVGFFVAIQQKIMGWRWTSYYFAGKEVLGLDSTVSLRITWGWTGFKVLGTTGNAETFGFYNAFAILFIIYNKYNNVFINLITIVLAFLNMWLSGMKTPFLIAILIVFSAVFLPKRKKIGIFSKFLIVILALVIFAYMILSSGSWSESSMYMRIVLWKDLLQHKHLINLVLPHSLFEYSNGAGNTGIISFWDNTYLFLGYSTGILGLVLFIRLLIRKYNEIQRNCTDKFFSFAFFFLILSSITTCLFFGRNIIGILFILIGIEVAYKREGV